MTNQNVYDAPNASLSTNNSKKASFTSLNFWRKLYLVLMWIGTTLMTIAFIGAGIDSPEVSIIHSGLFASLMLGFTYWHHRAIVSRNLKHITILAVLNLIPLGNLIGCLIMFSIRRVTKKELEDFDFPDIE